MGSTEETMPLHPLQEQNSSKKYKISRNENKQKWRLKQQQQQEKTAITKLTTLRTLIHMHLNNIYILMSVSLTAPTSEQHAHTYKQFVKQQPPT